MAACIPHTMAATQSASTSFATCSLLATLSVSCSKKRHPSLRSNGFSKSSKCLHPSGPSALAPTCGCHQQLPRTRRPKSIGARCNSRALVPELHLTEGIKSGSCDCVGQRHFSAFYFISRKQQSESPWLPLE